MLAFNFFGATEGGLFDINATLPLMAIQVVALTYILNSLFFKPVGTVSYTHLTLPTILRV